jgi:predicted signal transduction protein with EAL and GGDEF domain
MLEAWGCDVAQGYHIARPMPAARVLAWLHASGPNLPPIRTDTSLNSPLRLRA